MEEIVLAKPILMIKKGKNIVSLTSRNKNNDIFNQQTDLSSPSKTSNKRTYYDNAQNQKFFNKNY